MKLRFTPRALRDLDEILSAGAERVKGRLRETFNLLARYPGLGRQTSDRRLRCLVTTPFPYLVFYKTAPREVVVIGVRHAARDPRSMPGR